jgi:hypothetical protein
MTALADHVTQHSIATNMCESTRHQAVALQQLHAGARVMCRCQMQHCQGVQGLGYNPGPSCSGDRHRMSTAVTYAAYCQNKRCQTHSKVPPDGIQHICWQGLPVLFVKVQLAPVIQAETPQVPAAPIVRSRPSCCGALVKLLT